MKIIKQKIDGIHYYIKMNTFWSSEDTVRPKKCELRSEKILTTYITNEGFLSCQSSIRKKGNNQLKLNKKHQQTFHRRGTWMTFEYMKRCSNSLATPEVHTDVSITLYFATLCVGKNVEWWEQSSTTHEVNTVADTLEESLSVCSNVEQVQFHS